jgi:hypothetical protein
MRVPVLRDGIHAVAPHGQMLPGLYRPSISHMSFSTMASGTMPLATINEVPARSMSGAR